MRSRRNALERDSRVVIGRFHKKFRNQTKRFIGALFSGCSPHILIEVQSAWLAEPESGACIFQFDCAI